MARKKLEDVCPKMQCDSMRGWSGLACRRSRRVASRRGTTGKVRQKVQFRGWTECAQLHEIQNLGARCALNHKRNAKKEARSWCAIAMRRNSIRNEVILVSEWGSCTSTTSVACGSRTAEIPPIWCQWMAAPSEWLVRLDFLMSTNSAYFPILRFWKNPKIRTLKLVLFLLWYHEVF